FKCPSLRSYIKNNRLHTEIGSRDLGTQTRTHTWIQKQQPKSFISAQRFIPEWIILKLECLGNECLDIGDIPNRNKLFHFNSSLSAFRKIVASSIVTAREGSSRMVFGFASPVKIPCLTSKSFLT